MTRAPLPNRRQAETFGFEHGGLCFTASLGFDHLGRVREIFLNQIRPNSTVDTAARDSAIAASLALQFGCPLAVLTDALGRDESGRPVTPLGAALALALAAEAAP